MGTNYNPSIIMDGLVLALDAANQKSINIPSQSDHGYADWYCLATGTATYSIVNSTGGSIYENNAGVITALVTATTPQRGTISITAGRIYYGSVPINLVVEDEQHSIAPLTMMGSQFWNQATRNNPSTYYVYSPYQAATVNFYDATTGGLTGTPTSTLSLSAGQSGTFTSNNLTNHWISSTTPILATVTQTAADRTILSPMAQYVYQRYVAYYSTTNFTTPTSVGTNVVYDSTYKVMAMTIADGSGGDCAQGLGIELLSDTYSWGNVLSDYVIVAPYSATTVTTYYWSGTAWVVWDTHSVSGTITAPAYVIRDGTVGPGLDGTALTGLATNMASDATLWKWESNKPIYLCINDSVDDEFSVLGWNKATTSSPRSSNKWNDLTNTVNGTAVGAITPVITDVTKCFDFTANLGLNATTAVSGFSWNPQPVPNTGSFTFNCWVKNVPTSVAGQQVFFSNAPDANGFRFGIGADSIYYLIGPTYTEGTLSFSGTFVNTQWNNVCVVFDRFGTYNSGVAQLRGYLNGVLFNSVTLPASQTAWTTVGYTTAYMAKGLATFASYSGKVSKFDIYSRALSVAEIKQNFNAVRGRHGI